MLASSSKPYNLPKVALQMVKEPPLYSSDSDNCPDDAVRLVRNMLQSYDREAVVIVNFDNRAKPINLNIVSMGTINAASVMMIHNHPSGEIEPSAEDIKITNTMYPICKLMDISLRDHIIIADQERYYSFTEHNVFE